MRDRQKQRSIALSDSVIKEIKDVTKDCISLSGFIRLAIKGELERWKK